MEKAEIVTVYRKKDTEGTCPYFPVCKELEEDNCNDCPLEEVYARQGKRYAANP